MAEEIYPLHHKTARISSSFSARKAPRYSYQKSSLGQTNKNLYQTGQLASTNGGAGSSGAQRKCRRRRHATSFCSQQTKSNQTESTAHAWTWRRTTGDVCARSGADHVWTSSSQPPHPSIHPCLFRAPTHSEDLSPNVQVQGFYFASRGYPAAGFQYRGGS